MLRSPSMDSHGIAWKGVCLLLLCCGCGETTNSGAARVGAAIDVSNVKSVRKAFEDHVSEHGTAVGRDVPDEYKIEIIPFDESTWLVYATWTRVVPSSTATYLVDSKGVREATLRNLVHAHQMKFGASHDEKDHHKIIESIIEIHSAGHFRHPAVLISSTEDIPNYDKVHYGTGGNRIGGPLDPDLEPAVRPLWKEERASGDRSWSNIFYVVYTYNQLGGIVSRYKFQFNGTAPDESGQDQWQIYTANHIRLGGMVGDFRMLQ